MEIKFHVSENHLSNDEMEYMSSIQTRYLMQSQKDDQNFLKINLSKSEFDSISIELDSIKNNFWITNVMNDGFKFFKVDNYDLISISKSSDNLLVTKEFYRIHQREQNESFVCMIGDAAFDCKFWQNGR